VRGLFKVRGKLLRDHRNPFMRCMGCYPYVFVRWCSLGVIELELIIHGFLSSNLGRDFPPRLILNQCLLLN